MSYLAYLSRAAKQPYHWGKGVLANLAHGFPSRKLRIIGVTGTDGKTTTSTLIYSMLKAAGKKVALISTVAAYIGEDEVDTGFHVTSPDPFALQRLLKKIAALQYEFVVLESTSHGIYQHRLLGIRPEVAVLTNITHEHLDYHGTFKEYVRVKSSFLARAKIVLINKQDKATKQVKELLKHHDGKIFEYDLRSMTPAARTIITKRFPEPYNRENAAAALMACEALNLAEDQCLRAIEKFGQVEGRMNELKNDAGIRVIVDFAHTPNALEAALRALRSQLKPGKKLIAVFGSAGLRDNTKRPLMGKVASQLADEVVLTAEDPRTENAEVIIHQIKDGATQNWGHLHDVVDRREAITFAVTALAKAGDIVGIFGKGHEKSMNLDGKTEIAWSDHDEATRALSLRKAA
ncbi:MAG TPA: UDP-N-acetylmuramoyl-L-alanyl-D-glutamate--2,6-diaminopimelate ligase [Candidatus Saccharimonadia bacterium]|nr:UDP-N-acetylmuramoyl-L-alanyl-D-glutamate--2,6-diaminopimelate ligase [Candidatus Saccharimonadia bacterium]